MKTHRFLLAVCIFSGIVMSAPPAHASRGHGHPLGDLSSWVRSIVPWMKPRPSARAAPTIDAGDAGSDVIPIVSWGRIKDLYRDPGPAGGGKD